jgi:hypothetical protein
VLTAADDLHLDPPRLNVIVEHDCAFAVVLPTVHNHHLLMLLESIIHRELRQEHQHLLD